jgi:hypothetical protein
MTKPSFLSAPITRLIIVWVVIGLLTISIMKAGALAAQSERVSVFEPIPALSWKK